MSNQDDDRDSAASSSDWSSDSDQSEPEIFARLGPSVSRGKQQKTAGLSKGCWYGLAGCGCLTGLVTVGAVAGFWALLTWFGNIDSDDPAIVRKTAQEIADFEPPASFEPAFVRRLAITRIVMYQSEDGGSMLILEHSKAKRRGFWTGFDEAFIKKLEADGFGHKPNFQSGPKPELRDIKIRGQNARVNFADGSLEGTPYKQIAGTFQGKAGPVSLTLVIPKEQYQEADVLKFLEGIK